MIRVKDLDSALNFYCTKLGLVETHRIENEAGKYTLVFLAAQADAAQAKSTKAPLLELTYNWDSNEVYAVGRNFGHLAFEVENIYHTCKGLQEEGITINRPPRDGRMAFIKSPDGISIELLQAGEALVPSEPWKSMENEGEW